MQDKFIQLENFQKAKELKQETPIDENIGLDVVNSA